MKRCLFILLLLPAMIQAGDTLITREWTLFEDTYIRNPGLGTDSIRGGYDTMLIGNNSSQDNRMLLTLDNASGGTLDDFNDTLDIVDSMVYCSIQFRVKTVVDIVDADTCIVNPLLVAFEEDSANWANRKGSTAWNTAGCNGSGTDYTTAFHWSKKISDTTASSWFKFDVTNYFDSLVSGNVATFHGFRVYIYNDPRNDYLVIHSSDVDDFSNIYRPQLKAKFWMQTPVASEGATTNRHGNPNRHGATRH